jgi:hypothetical protein
VSSTNETADGRCSELVEAGEGLIELDEVNSVGFVDERGGKGWEFSGEGLDGRESGAVESERSVSEVGREGRGEENERGGNGSNLARIFEREIVARRLLQKRTKLPHALVQLVMTADCTGAKSEDIDVLPARKLDDILNLLLNSSALRDESAGDTGGELTVEGMDVVEEVADALEGSGAVAEFL